MLHRKVQCWIFSRNTAQEPSCLLLKTNALRGEFWQPVTGTVESNEGYFEAACRETSEETKFRFSSPPTDIGYEFDFHSRFGPTRERVFALIVEDMPNPELDPKEHQAFQWIDPHKALELLKFPSNKDGLKHSFEKLFGKKLL